MTGRRTLGWLAVVLALTVTMEAQAKRPETLLQEALNKEKIAGDIDGAITLLKPLAEHDRPDIAARALVALGRLYDRLGQAQARSTFERVVRQFPNQAEAVKEARGWLAANAPAAATPSGPLHETLWKGSRIESPAPFPDGRSVVYIDWVTGKGDLAVRDLKTGRNRLLTKDAGWDFYENPLPSRDGKRIAYRYGERESTIRVANADATNARVVLRDNHVHWLADWSPDGRQLSAVRDNRDGTNTIVLIDVADGKSTQLLTVRRGYPQGDQFSPDGKYLVYALSGTPPAEERNGTPAENGGVFLLPLDGRAPIPVIEGPHIYDWAAWTPDGRHVVFVSNRSVNKALWSVPVAEGKAAGAPVVVDNDFQGVFARFSADGTLFSEYRENVAEAYVADFDSRTLTVGKHTPISDRGIGKNREPELSPDGRQVAFVRNTTPATIVVRALATGEERNVTTFRPVYGAQLLQWFPDGRSLLIVQREGDRRKLFRKVDLATGEARTLFEAPWSVWTGALSHDGSMLYYSLKDEEQRIHLVRRQLASGEESRLYMSPPSPGTGLFGLSLSPDGKQLAFARNTEGEGRILTILPVAGGTPRDILQSDQIFAPGSFAWTPDGKHLLFSVRTSHDDHQLTAIATDTGAFKPLGVIMQRINSRMLSADGRRIVFGEAKQTIEVRTLRNFLPSAAAVR
jgi:Tol biopolymer transport system component